MFLRNQSEICGVSYAPPPPLGKSRKSHDQHADRGSGESQPFPQQTKTQLLQNQANKESIIKK